MKLLLVEDNTDQADTTKFLLEHGGDVSVTIASNGTDAADLILDGTFDGFIIDLMIPGLLSGKGLLDLLKAHCPEVPVFIVTGYDQIERLPENAVVVNKPLPASFADMVREKLSAKHVDK